MKLGTMWNPQIQATIADDVQASKSVTVDASTSEEVNEFLSPRVHEHKQATLARLSVYGERPVVLLDPSAQEALVDFGLKWTIEPHPELVGVSVAAVTGAGLAAVIGLIQHVSPKAGLAITALGAAIGAASGAVATPWDGPPPTVGIVSGRAVVRRR